MNIEELDEIEITLKTSKPYNELGTYNYFNCESIEKLLKQNTELKEKNFKLQARADRLTQNNKILNQQKEEAYKIADDYYKENTVLKEQILLLKSSEPMLEFAKQTYKDNWNKLKECLRSLYDFDEGVVSADYLECVEDTLNKMQEIEGGMNE